MKRAHIALLSFCFLTNIAFGKDQKSSYILRNEFGQQHLVYIDAVDKDGEKCDRTITYDWLMKAENNFLTAEEKKTMDSGKQVVKFITLKNGYLMSYVFQAAGYDPEFVMAVYSNVSEHKGANGLGDYIVQSEVEEAKKDPYANPFHVFYEQHVDSPYANGEYTNLTWVDKLEDGSYILDAKLVDSNDASFAPRWLDGYLKAYPFKGKNVFVVACNYMLPRTAMWKETYKNTFKERMVLSGQNMIGWLNRVLKDPKVTEEYRDRLHKLLANRKK